MIIMSKNSEVLNLLNESDEIISRSKDIIKLRNLSKHQSESPLPIVDDHDALAMNVNNNNSSSSSIIVDESVLTDDIASMPLLDDRTIAASLKAKYENKAIYSYLGESLVAVNPLEKLKIYDDETIKTYKNAISRSDHNPHVYWFGLNTYKNAIEKKQNNIIALTGESGSSKTETCKYLIEFLANISCSSEILKERLLKSLQILEAFGHANNGLNPNSTRFAKFIELRYTFDGKLESAKINDYMLEKTRVVLDYPHEKNFHIFYYILTGLDKELLTKLHLNGIQSHKITRYNEIPNNVCLNEWSIAFERLKQAMLTFGFPNEALLNIYKVLAGIILLCDIEFQALPESNDRVVYVVDERPLIYAAELLCISNQDLTSTLISISTITTAGRKRWPRNLEQAKECRDNLAKSMYSRLFGWIVKSINSCLNSVDISQEKPTVTIGLIDMFGFENLHKNSFEQLVVNTVNEEIQNVFYRHSFDYEQKNYQREGLSFPPVTYKDNNGALELLLQKPIGIFHVIKEECKLSDSDDTQCVEKLNEYFQHHADFINYKQKHPTSFGISHYAGKVKYESKNILAKNREYLCKSIIECMQKSEDNFIADIFMALPAPNGSFSSTRQEIRKSNKLVTNLITKIYNQNEIRNNSKEMAHDIWDNVKGISGQNIDTNTSGTSYSIYFTLSLNDILSKLENSKTNFIRCIKPNERITNRNMSMVTVTKQVKDLAISEYARVIKHSYPIKIDQLHFLLKYQSLHHPLNLNPTRDEIKQHCLQILQTSGAKNFRVALTQVFMKQEDYGILQKALKYKSDKHDENANILKNDANIETNDSPPTGILKNRRKSCDVSSITGHGGIPPPIKINSENQNDIETANISKTSKTILSPNPNLKGIPKSFPEASNNLIQPKLEQEYWWDVARVTSRDYEIEQLHLRSRAENLKILFKLIAYLLFILIVLGSAVISKLSLFMMINAYKREPRVSRDGDRDEHIYRIRWHIMLAIAVCTPYFLSFLSSLQNVLFKDRKGYPHWLVVIWVIVVETSQSLGTSLFIFKVLPSISNMNALFLMNATCILPLIFKIIFASSRGLTRLKKIVILTLDILAIACQASIWFICNKSYYNQKVNSNFQKMQPDSYFPLYVIASTLLMSLGWWETYAEMRFSTNKFFMFIQNQISDLRKYRSKIYVFINPMKIVLIFAFGYALLPRILRNQYMNFNMSMSSNITFKQDSDQTVSFTTEKLDKFTFQSGFHLPLIVNIISSAICYFSSRLACKVLMQSFGFALPLSLSTPVTFTLMALVSRLKSENITYFGDPWKNTLNIEGFDSSKTLVTICIGFFLYWLSNVWAVSHVWFSKLERLAKNERIFSVPYYEATTLEQGLMLNRRRLDEIVPDEELQETIEFAGKKKTKYPIPFIYLCATMWHETTNEITQLLKSVFRMDRDQHARKMAQKLLHVTDPDYYKFETHILFDDAFECDENDSHVPNRFVRQFVSSINVAAAYVHGVEMTVGDPIKVPTPYGGRLVWIMPGNNKIIVHLKDKDKIRHRKRWSQVMYMYYLLSYKLLGKKEHKEFQKKYNLFHDFSGFGDFIKSMSEERKVKAQNTFVLALDGDVDFKPEAVLLLVDRMRKNPKVGAACGRIHPIGSGPMVWYQKFEYAVGHWLQKAAEHKLGCVLCSPGCFSLFRGSALMDDNVMRRYADKATEASHYVQYDQGEDRWLCTLLLQEGYRVDYCAASDALTYAPDTFKEFFNQRRRWMPSTIANILDLLKDAKHTILVNENISTFYIFYQGFLLASTILGPGTILLTIASSFRTVFTSLTLAESYTLAVAPAVFYLIICLKTKPDTQIFVGALMSSIYSMIMTMVLVATIAQLTNSDELSASSFFFVLLIVLFFVTGCLHPQEIMNLVYGILYLVTLPGGYVLLVIYSICNLHIVSWGTREDAVKVKKNKNQNPNQPNEDQSPSKRGRIATYFIGDGYNKKGVMQSVFEFFQHLIRPSSNRQEQILLEICHRLEVLRDGTKHGKTPLSAANTLVDNITPNQVFFPGSNKRFDMNNNNTVNSTVMDGEQIQEYDGDIDIPRNDLFNPFWLDVKFLGKNDVYYLNTKEITFWKGLIDKYLHPLSQDEGEEKRLTQDLKELRNNSCFAFFMLNALWVVMQFQFEYVSMIFPKLQVPIGLLYNRPDQKVQILGLVFLTLFTVVLLLQFGSMIFHRWGTVIEILASTRILKRHHKYRKANMTIQEAVDLIKEMELEKRIDLQDTNTTSTNSNVDTTSDEPEPDYLEAEEEDILPEPEPDYFEHPAVQEAENWNRRNKLMSPAWNNQQQGPLSARSFGNGYILEQFPNIDYENQSRSNINYNNNNHNISSATLGAVNTSSNSNNKHQYPTPFSAGMRYANFDRQASQFNGMRNTPRQSALKPLQSLDDIIMRKFKTRERDSNFKKKVKQIQDSNKVLSPNTAYYSGYNV